MTNPLAGLALDYLIGRNGEWDGTEGRITELPYDCDKVPSKGIGVAYCNLFDEYNTGNYGPYLTTSDTASEYNEGQIDPRGPGWYKNLHEQFERRRKLGFEFEYAELDNSDAYPVKDVIDAIDLAAEYRLKIIAKNPGLMDGGVQIVAHPNVYGIIVEKGAGIAADMDTLRRLAEKPNLPVWFVFFGDGRPAAETAAFSIDDAQFPNMGVTYSSEGEYGNAVHILLPIKGQPMARIAKSLDTLRSQVNALWPNRDKSSDGWIGDASHASRTSDHNPNSAGVVTALDITHDPAHGLDAHKLAHALVDSRDPRIKYIISNAQIISSKVSPWQWRPYTGSNRHDRHVHVSVDSDPALYDDSRGWVLEKRTEPPRPGVQTAITATRFRDDQVAYSDVAPGWNDRMGVALPHRFQKSRPKVKVTNPRNGKSVVCDIIDIGPWYDGTEARGPFDPYWQSGSRPRAETDIWTNGAGIDLTFPVDAALGLDGKGLVDWEFVEPEPAPIPVPEPDLNPVPPPSAPPTKPVPPVSQFTIITVLLVAILAALCVLLGVAIAPSRGCSAAPVAAAPVVAPAPAVTPAPVAAPAPALLPPPAKPWPPVTKPSKPKPEKKTKAPKSEKVKSTAPTAAQCQQLAQGLSWLGRAGVIQAAKQRGYSEAQTEAALKACGH